MEPQEKILRTSLNLFFRYGIKHVTMDEIAKELGMSKKTIYQFYKEKDDLVNQLCDIEMLGQERVFNKINGEAKDPIHEIMLISLKMREMMQNINPIFFMDLQKFYPEAFKRFQRFKKECAFQNIVNNIKRGIALGIYRKDIDVEFTAQYRLSQIDILMFGNHFTHDKISFAKAHELLFELFVYGICTVKGHKLINDYKNAHDGENGEH